MICEKCKADMNWFSEDSVQGWVCSNCGWNLMTTNIAGVNFIIARKMLMESYACILKDEAPKIKDAIEELEKLKIQFEVIPKFRH